MKQFKYIYCLFITIIACDDIIEVEDISDKTVSILAPTHNAVLDTLITTFTWEVLEETEAYYLQVATPGFDNASQIVIDTFLVKTNFSKLLPINSYEWRIRAENSGYKTAYTQQSFTIEE